MENLGNETTNVKAKYDDLIKSEDVFVFMKGVPTAPMCGFSQNTCFILDLLGVKYGSYDILADSEMRQKAKEFSSWPTYPQVYVKGEFVGGNDILTEMYKNGQLQELVKDFKKVQ